MKKRLAVLFLVVALLATVAGPCALSEEATEDPIKITWISYQMEALADDPVLIDYWNEFFNVDIEVWNLDNASSAEQIGLWFAADQVPDFMGQGFNINDFQKYAKEGMFAEIPEEMIQEHMPTVMAMYEKASPGCTSYGIIDGVRYGFPREVRFHNQFRGVLAYRGDWMANVGVEDTPETIEEFVDLMYKFAQEDPDQNGENDTYGLSETGMNAVYGAYGYLPKLWVERDGKLVYTSIQPEMKDALATLRDMYADGVLSPDFITGENYGGYWAISNAFAEGSIGFSGMGSYYHWHGDIGVNENYNPDALAAICGQEAADSIRFGLPLSSSYGEGVINGAAMYDGNEMAFGYQVQDDPEKMAKILDMHEYWSGGDIDNYDPQHYFDAWFGFEDEMWYYDDNGVPQLMEGWTMNDLSANGGHNLLACAQTVESMTAMYKYRYDWAVEHQFNVGKMQYSLLMSPLPSQTIYLTELEKICDSTFTGIITGEKDLEEFDAFVEEWLAQGGATLVDEANAWWETQNK